MVTVNAQPAPNAPVQLPKPLPYQQGNYVPQNFVLPPAIQAVGSDVGYNQLTGIQAPQLNPVAQSSAPQIQQWQQQSTDVALNALKQLYGIQTQQQREQLSQRGVIGSGVETNTLRNLYAAQNQQTDQTVSGIANQALQQLIQDEQMNRQINSQIQLQNATLQQEAQKMGQQERQFAWSQGQQSNIEKQKLDLQERQFAWQSAAEDAKNNRDAYYKFVDQLRLSAGDESTDWYRQQANAAARKWGQELPFPAWGMPGDIVQDVGPGYSKPKQDPYLNPSNSVFSRVPGFGGTMGPGGSWVPYYGGRR